MNKIILFFTILFTCFLVACNNQSTNTASNTAKTSNDTASHWTDANELEFMNECVDSAKTHYNNDSVKAYAFCKCMLKQVKAKYSIYDSTTIEKLQQDTAAVRQMAQNCK